MPKNTYTRRIKDMAVAGVTFEGRQTTLANMMAVCNGNRDIDVKLVRVHDNPYDANAIEVWARPRKRGNWNQIGFVPRTEASKMAPTIDAGHGVIIDDAILVGGSDERSIGLRLDLRCLSTKADDPATERQLRYVRALEMNGCPAFHGNTKAEATAYINAYANA